MLLCRNKFAVFAVMQKNFRFRLDDTDKGFLGFDTNGQPFSVLMIPTKAILPYHL